MVNQLHDNCVTASRDVVPKTEDVAAACAEFYNEEGSKTEDAPIVPPSKLRIWKNVFILSFSWMFFNASLTTVVSVQSSLIAEEGLGTDSLSVLYASSAITSFFLTSACLRRFGPKITNAIGAVLFTAYMISNFYPTWGLMIPASVLTGAGQVLISVSIGVYIGKLADYYACVYNLERGKVFSRFYGTYYAIYYSHHLFSDLLESLIMGVADSDSDDDDKVNITYDRNICGVNYCNQDIGTSFMVGQDDDDDDEGTKLARVYGLYGFCLGCAILGGILAIFLVDPIERLTGVKPVPNRKSPCANFGATLLQLRDYRMFLLVPILTYNGFDDLFIEGELSKAYITCALGIQYVGLVSMMFAVTLPLLALSSAWWTTDKNQWMSFLLLAVAHSSCLTGMFIWRPANGSIYLYVISGIWGVGSGVCGSQLNAFIGKTFTDELESASSNYYLWNFLGNVIFFAISSSVCSRAKLIYFCSLLGVGLIGYFIVAFVQRHKRRQNDNNNQP